MGVDILQLNSDKDKIDYITIHGNVYTHKQVEKRNGITYMRIKKRSLNMFK